MSTWQLAEAEAQFREVVDRALRDGPQMILDNGTGVVVISADEYQALAKPRATASANADASVEDKPDFISFLLGGPLVDDFTIDECTGDAGAAVEHQPTVETQASFKDHLLRGPRVDDFTIERDPSPGREVDL